MNDPGVVYIIRTKYRPFVKIGRSKSREGAEKRLKAIQRGNPFPCELAIVHEIENDVCAVEWALHRLFNRYRTQGEWFELPDMFIDKTLIEIIDGLSTYTWGGLQTEFRREIYLQNKYSEDLIHPELKINYWVGLAIEKLMFRAGLKSKTGLKKV